MDQNVVLQKDTITIVPSPSDGILPYDLVQNTGRGVVIPNSPDMPKPQIQVQLTKDSPVNVVLVTLYGNFVWNTGIDLENTNEPFVLSVCLQLQLILVVTC